MVLLLALLSMKILPIPLTPLSSLEGKMNGLEMPRPLKVLKVYGYIYYNYITVLTILFITYKILYKNDKLRYSIIVYKL